MNRLKSFSGAILAGGSSTRMGADKAFLEVPTTSHPEGLPMVSAAANALRAAGAFEVIAIGGDAVRLGALGLDVRTDRYPGEGPLGGLLTALTETQLDVTVLLTCDLPAITGSTVRGLVHGLELAPTAMVATALRRGRRQILTAAYRRAAEDELQRRFDDGERSVRRALADLEVVVVEHLDPETLIDLDSPEAVEQYAQAFRAVGRSIPFDERG